MTRNTIPVGGGAPERPADDEAALHYLQLLKMPRGTVINERYRIERTIGKGGFGIVFAATDTVLLSFVALKFLDPRYTGDRRKFLRVQREINIARRLTSPHVAKIFSLEQWRGVHFLVMELVEGWSLRDMMKERGRFPWEEFNPLFLQILEGMQALHRENIIHRDLKPTNILVTRDNLVKILDFGLAKDLTDNESTSAMGEIVGSPFYMTPEQIAGSELDLQSDIYQLGLILYEALAGVHPFGNATTMELMVKHLHERPPRVDSQRLGLPAYVRYGIEKALEKKKALRFHDIEQMIECFRLARAPVWDRLRTTMRRFPNPMLIGVAALLLLGVTGAVLALAAGSLRSLDTGPTTVSGRNRLGGQLWRRDFAPFGVLQAHLTANRSLLPERTHETVAAAPLETVLAGHPAVVVFLINPRRHPFSDWDSIIAGRLDNQVAVLDERGEVRWQKSLFEAFVRDDGDSARAYDIGSFTRLDADGDGATEIQLLIRQYQGRGPSTLVLLKGLRVFSFTSPGEFALLDRRLDRDGRADLLFHGTNDRLDHAGFLAEVNLRLPQTRLDGFPVLDGGGPPELPARQWLLPRGWVASECRWFGDGWVDFYTADGAGSLRVWRWAREGSAGREGGYPLQDEPAMLRQAYSLLNEAVRLDSREGDPKRALAAVYQARALPLRNPSLLSLLDARAGDLLARLGHYASARLSLELALMEHRRNDFAVQRLCEIDFLSGDPLGAVQRIGRLAGRAVRFWNLPDCGTELFRGLACLQAGLFHDAENEFRTVAARLSTAEELSLLPLLQLFTGRYDDALSGLRRYPLQQPRMLLDIRDYRMLLGRALLLAGKEADKAFFFLSDLKRHSPRFREAPDMCLAWLLARRGDLREAAAKARTAMERLADRARGDLQARLWLFHDAWLYGEVMRLAGETDEARRGYQACIDANPYTALAGEARARLTGLRKR